MSDFLFGFLFAANCFGLFVLWLGAFRSALEESSESRRLALFSEERWLAYKARWHKQCSRCGEVGSFADTAHCPGCKCS